MRRGSKRLTASTFCLLEHFLGTTPLGEASCHASNHTETTMRVSARSPLILLSQPEHQNQLSKTILDLLIPARTPGRKVKTPDMWPQSSYHSRAQLLKQPQLWPQTSCIRESCSCCACCNPCPTES